MARRHTTRLPIIVTETSYAQAALAAESEGVSLTEYAEAALAVAIARTHARDREACYAQACRQAAARCEVTPTRWEFFGARRQPLVRPRAAPRASGKQRAVEPPSWKTVPVRQLATPDAIPVTDGGNRPSTSQTGRIMLQSTDLA